MADYKELNDEKLNDVNGGILYATNSLNGGFKYGSVYQNGSNFYWLYANDGTDKIKVVVKFYAYGCWDRDPREYSITTKALSTLTKRNEMYSSREDFINNFNPY